MAKFIYDEKHFAIKVCFFTKDYQSSKAAKDACYKHKDASKKTGEVYYTRDEQMHFYWQ